VKKYSKKENSILKHEYSNDGEFFNNSSNYFIYINGVFKVDYYITNVYNENNIDYVIFKDSMESFLYVLILLIKKNI
jgi:hypothetical protein